MRTQRLIILGILKEGPKHGYEIKKIIRKDLGVFVSAENKSIYYPLKMMEKQGFINKKTAKGKAGLARKMYSITPAGDREFFKLANQALLSQSRPFIDIDIPLYFLSYLEEREVLVRLRLRKRFLEKVKQWLNHKLREKTGFSDCQRFLLRHHLNLLKAEEDFLEEVTGMIKSQADTARGK